jgi:hypothetical protein
MGKRSPEKLTAAPQVQADASQTLPPVQALPHLPQCAAAVAVSTQAPPQLVGASAGQEVTHAPAPHATSHALPHLPQFFGSL